MMTEHEKLVSRLYGAAFHQGTLELREGVSFKSLDKAEDAVQRARAEVLKALDEVERLRQLTTSQPIETAPKDGTPIVAWCVHEADPYYVGTNRLTTYGAHAEGLRRVEDGYHVVVFGGAYDGIPEWWFQYGSEFEVVANPTHWLPLPKVEGV